MGIEATNADRGRIVRRNMPYGPWALVTGASDGIGRQFAEQLADRGSNLILTARRAAVLEELAASLRSKAEVVVRPADLGNPAEVRALLEETASLDVGLFVAAAGFGVSGDLIDSDLDHQLNMVDVNCRALLHMTHVMSRRFVERGGGGIVLLSSVVGFQGVPRAANYAATKAYVQSLAEGLAHELRPKGVDVVASAPGPVESGFADRADMRMTSTLAPSVVARETLSALGRAHTVRPGLMTKFLLTSLALLPRWARVRAVGQVMWGMTKHQQSQAAS